MKAFKSTTIIDKSNNIIETLNVVIRLDDECNNGIDDFSITGNYFNNNGDVTSGGIIDIINEKMPQLSDITLLHLCNVYGQPLYPIDNGMYWLKKDVSIAKKYLRLTDKELITLSEICQKNDESLFKKSLYSLGIIERWNNEALQAISHIEKLANTKYIRKEKENDNLKLPLILE